MGVNQLITTNLAAFATFENERLKQCKRIQATKKKWKVSWTKNYD